MGMKTVNDDFLVLLRLHYTAENYAMIGKFARRVNNALDGDPRFQFSFRSITPLGGVNDKKITPITESQRRSIEVEISEISGLKQSPDLDENHENQVCYAAKGNSLIVRSTGRLAKCTVALSDDFNDIGTIMENGEIIVDQKKFRRWINPVIEGRLAEARCPITEGAIRADRDAAPCRLAAFVRLDGDRADHAAQSGRRRARAAATLSSQKITNISGGMLRCHNRQSRIVSGKRASQASRASRPIAVNPVPPFPTLPSGMNRTLQYHRPSCGPPMTL
jgi:hypothetical protein